MKLKLKFSVDVPSSRVVPQLMVECASWQAVLSSNYPDGNVTQWCGGVRGPSMGVEGWPSTGVGGWPGN